MTPLTRIAAVAGFWLAAVGAWASEPANKPITGPSSGDGTVLVKFADGTSISKEPAREAIGSWRAAAELVNAVAWPAATILAAWILRKALLGLIRELGSRASKISFMEVSVEFRPLQPAQTPTVVMNLKVTEPVPIMDSYAATLVQQIEAIKKGDYAIADLGSGKQWLTSRLFIFAVMLERMSSLEYFVFEATQGRPGRYVGTAPLGGVRWALARRYPWLEYAYAKAYSDVFGLAHTPPQAIITSTAGKLERPTAGGYPLAAELIKQFLSYIQEPQPGPDAVMWQPLLVAPSAPPTSWEHASWVDESLLLDVLKDVLEDEDNAVEFSRGTSTAERTLSVMRAPGNVVAAVSRSGRLIGLMDRRGLLEDFAKRQADPDAKAPNVNTLPATTTPLPSSIEP